MNDDVELSVDERDALTSMKRDAAPPQHIERALVGALRRQGLIRTPRRPWLLPTVAAAAVLIGFAAGYWGSLKYGDAQSAGPRYVLLLYAGSEGTPSSGHHDEYAQWARTVSAQGASVSGNELAVDTEEIGILPAPEAQTKPTPVLGYFVIDAHDIADARRIAATCPHLRYGGRIVLRRVVS
jgi:hypothetical protein